MRRQERASGNCSGFRSDFEEKLKKMEKERIKIEQHTFMGGLWLAAWLFTIGFLHLSLWRSILAIVLWPYYIGVFVRSLAH